MGWIRRSTGKWLTGLKAFREGITKQMEGLNLQDEGLAIVQDAVAKHPLRAFGPLLDAAMVSSSGSKLHPTASICKHVKCKCPAPSLPHPLLLILDPPLKLPHHQVCKTLQPANGKPIGLMLMVCANINVVDMVWFRQWEMLSWVTSDLSIQKPNLVPIATVLSLLPPKMILTEEMVTNVVRNKSFY